MNTNPYSLISNEIAGMRIIQTNAAIIIPVTAADLGAVDSPHRLQFQSTYSHHAYLSF
jgi:hypothetical protein